jgi:hypothetical protein
VLVYALVVAAHQDGTPTANVLKFGFVFLAYLFAQAVVLRFSVRRFVSSPDLAAGIIRGSDRAAILLGLLATFVVVGNLLESG